MSLLQISDPSIKNDDLKKFVVGIDLGTTNSLIASYDSGLIIYEDNNSSLIPSVVTINSKGNISIGADAIKNSDDDKSICLESIKRIMGLSYTDIEELSLKGDLPLIKSDNNLPSVIVNNEKYSAIDISSKILLYLKKLAEDNENKPLDGAVITVPAYFNDIQRQATKNAAKLAGINVLRLLNEPTAAALAYGLESNETGSFIIYDFGGGTFDVSVLTLEKGIFKVLSTDGNTHLGGDDIDYEISNWLLNNHSFLKGYKTADLKKYSRILKESIIDKEFTSMDIDGNTISLSQNNFSKIIDPILDKTFDIVANALDASGLSKHDIKNIILVGGSTRIHCIKYILEKK